MTKNQSHPEAPEPPILTEQDFREGRRMVFLLTTIVFAGFVAFVYLYGTFGGPLVDSLSDRIGENVSARARNLADAGLTTEAIDLFRESLTKRFNDEPQQRIWTIHRLARLLIEEKRFGEAIAVLRDAEQLDPADGSTYSLLSQALRGNGQNDLALALSQGRVAYAEKAADRDALQAAHYDCGVIYRDAGDTEKALASFRASYDAVPATFIAWQVANMLVKLNRGQEALPYLDFILTKGDGTLLPEARELKVRIAGSSGGS